MEGCENSHFVISLDFELMWGVRDHLSVAQYGANIRGVREAIPRMLELFDRFEIRATWATVGFLFFEDKDELMAGLPSLRPRYQKDILSNYNYLSEAGHDEKDDPHYFGFSLLKKIQACPSQEIATHTFSHYYCLEDGQSPNEFRADIEAAIAVARRKGIDLKSIVFPRNQYSENHLAIAETAGLKTFRGNERSWVYRPTNADGQNKLRRAARLADHYFNLTGHHVQHPTQVGGLTEIASSRFLRPYSRIFAPMDRLRLSRTKRAIDSAASQNGIFHLWWHPHNFGVNLRDNLEFLAAILGHFAKMRETLGMRSSRMDDFT
jgi:peptidoglycan/xylan/chitin deacetylase (PgdA/CDA1 family)